MIGVHGVKSLFKNKRIIISTTIALVAVFLVAIINTIRTEAAISSISISVASDGTAPFDGLDANANNGIVRTNDTITYNWNYATDAGGGFNTVFTQTLPTGSSWTPASLGPCMNVGTDSSISPDGLTITCRIDAPPNQTAQIQVTARVSSNGSQNGDVINGEVSVTQGGDTQNSNTVQTTVAAAPQVDLRKDYDITVVESMTGSDGTTEGVLVLFGVGMTVDNSNGRKGHEELASPLTFTDDLANVSPNAEVVTWHPDYECGPNNVGARVTSLPQGNGGGASGVTNSGSWSCSQVGSSVSVTITGADTTAEHIPSQTVWGAALPSNLGYIVAGYIPVWIPNDDLPPSGMFNGTNQYTDFDPNSVSGQSNFGPGYEPGGEPGAICTVGNNNCESFSVPVDEANFWKYLAKDDSINPPTLTGSSSITDNQGLLTPGEPFSAGLVFENDGLNTIAAGELLLCDKWDNSIQLINQASPPVNAWLVQGNGSIDHVPVGAAWTVEYTNRVYADDTERANATCGTPGDMTTDGPWYSNIGDVPGGAAAITGLRIQYNNAFEVGQVIHFRPNFVAGTQPTGTIVRNFGSGQSTSVDPWDFSSSAFATMRAAFVAITKDTIPSGIETVTRGQEVDFTLNPSLIADGGGSPAPIDNVTVVDELPSCTTYVIGSASIEPTSITPADPGLDGILCTGDDVNGQTLTWNLGTLTPNDPIPPITYTVIVSGIAQNGISFVNNVQMSGDGTDESTDSDTLTVNDVSSFLVAKTSPLTSVEVDDQLIWDIAYSNSMDNNLGTAEIIDILPYNGDSRGTDFNGTLTLLSATPNAGSLTTTVEYTSEDPSTVDGNPQTNTNTWCEEVDFGDPGCPTTLADVTAIKIIDTDIAPGKLGHVQLTFDTLDTEDEDLFVNNIAGAAVSGLVSPIPETNDVPIVVVASIIGDRVWEDLNANGVQDSGEPGIENVTVTLTGTSSGDDGILGTPDDVPVSETTTTNANGEYFFTNLHSGEYTVTVSSSDPALVGFSITYDRAGGTATPTGTSGLFTLARDSEDLENDFGYVRDPLGTIGDRVWSDLNGNGIQDSGEPGIPGVTVHLLDSSNNILETTTTDSVGNYEFTDLLAGDYRVEFVQPVDYTPAPYQQGSDPALDSDANPADDLRSPIISLAAGEVNLTIDAGFIPDDDPVLGSIGSFVWEDLNRNGIQDPGEPGIPGVTVRLLDGSGNFLQQTVTDNDGHYLFTDLAPGQYIVEFTLPAGYHVSPQHAGSPGDDSDADPITLRSGIIDLGDGEAVLIIDAGFYRIDGSNGRDNGGDTSDPGDTGSTEDGRLAETGKNFLIVTLIVATFFGVGVLLFVNQQRKLLQQ